MGVSVTCVDTIQIQPGEFVFPVPKQITVFKLVRFISYYLYCGSHEPFIIPPRQGFE